MWAWFRLGWARSLLLAALLGGVNLAAQRYTMDTQAATRMPEFSSLKGLRAWRVSYQVPRRDGLLGVSESANTRALLQWSKGADYLAASDVPQNNNEPQSNNESQAMPSLWRLALGAFVQEPQQRGGSYYSVMVAMGLDWPADACWPLSTGSVSFASRLSLNELASCKPLGSPDARTAAKLAQTQQEIKALWRGGPDTLVIGRALADRALGRDWQQTIAEAWVGAGGMPIEKAGAKGEAGADSVASSHVSLAGLQASGWTVHAIRHAPSALQQQAATARLRWQWAMAALGFALGVLGAWGYRHVLALMVAIRRTGGARWMALWLDGLKLVLSLAALLIAGSALVMVMVMAMPLMCGASCGTAPAPGALKSMQTWADGLAWFVWPWTGLIAGLLVVASSVVWTASRRSLQNIVARGGQG